jgi:hypothetical protein
MQKQISGLTNITLLIYNFFVKFGKLRNPRKWPKPYVVRTLTIVAERWRLVSLKNHPSQSNAECRASD